MLYETRQVTLKNGQEAVLRSPQPGDAAAMMDYLRTCAAETNFILRYPEECDDTEQEEAAFLQAINDSPRSLMLVCLVEGRIVGNCHLNIQKRIKTRHRAGVAIAIIRAYWGQGLGTLMFSELIRIGRELGVKQLELEYVEGNARAKALYEKLGFVETGTRPDAIRLKDGSFLDEVSMVRWL